MVRRKPLVIVTRKLPEVIETRMMELFETRLNESDAPWTKAELIEAIKTAEILVPTVTDRITSSVLAHANPNLRLIANYGTGVDHIDIEAAYARGITVTNTPGVLTEDTADMSMALILAVSRRLVEGERLARSGEWSGWSPTSMLGHRITGKRLGILGMGRIGSAVARRARGFGLAIHYHNRRRVPQELENELEATYWESLDQMVARMDIISVNCPHTPATFHLLSARRLKLLRPDAIIVNTSRGEVIDEAALARMLRNKELAGAGLDVFEHEPAINPQAARARQRGAPAAHGVGDHRGPDRHGREGRDQHQDLRRRPSPARPGAAEPAAESPPRTHPRKSPAGPGSDPTPRVAAPAPAIACRDGVSRRVARRAASQPDVWAPSSSRPASAPGSNSVAKVRPPAIAVDELRPPVGGRARHGDRAVERDRY